MEPKIDIGERVLLTTLKEIRLQPGDEESAGDPCVICLEQISDKAQAQPCCHSNFDFVCLVNWLENALTCPLCKAVIETVNYQWSPSGSFEIYNVNASRAIEKETPVSLRPRPRRYVPRPTRQRQDGTNAGISFALARRREVYQGQLYSLHVGSNVLSGFHDITPEMMTRDPELVSKAKNWIRRELQVFDFLKTAGENPAQRPRNAEFLLQYIVAILKLVDLKGSEGQAEDMLQEFLGRSNARIFLHELRSWLRSPYDSMEVWDRHVQYMEANRSPIVSRYGDDANL